MPASVLLADDNPHARRMGAQYLADLGYAVEAVGDGPAALAALAAAPLPRLILADAALPGLGVPLGGLELLRQLRTHPAWRAIPVLLLVGALAPVADAALAAADGVLRKPLSSAGLERWLPRLPGGPAPPDPPQLSPSDLLLLAVREAAQAGSPSGPQSGS